MSAAVAALPMYDWPETRAATDALWAAVRDALHRQGFEAPDAMVRRNGDMPAVPGGICDADGRMIAPDPAALPPGELDLGVLWRHPRLLLAQACWGPMENGLAAHVRVVGQPDYSMFDGGEGEFYSSVVLMRGGEGPAVPAPADGRPDLSRRLLRGRRFAYNSSDSMSGVLALSRDLAVAGESLSLFDTRIETGGHRASIVAVAAGRADVCAVDCRSWALARRFEPAARALQPVGWTARRRGLPYISAASTPDAVIAAMKQALAAETCEVHGTACASG